MENKNIINNLISTFSDIYEMSGTLVQLVDGEREPEEWIFEKLHDLSINITCHLACAMKTMGVSKRDFVEQGKEELLADVYYDEAMCIGPDELTAEENYRCFDAALDLIHKVKMFEVEREEPMWRAFDMVMDGKGYDDEGNEIDVTYDSNMLTFVKWMLK